MSGGGSRSALLSSGALGEKNSFLGLFLIFDPLGGFLSYIIAGVLA
jgi:hypothetical protein